MADERNRDGRDGRNGDRHHDRHREGGHRPEHRRDRHDDDRWDWFAQRKDTEWTLKQIIREGHGVEGQKIDLDMLFVPNEEGDRYNPELFVRELKRAGFGAESWEEDDELFVGATAPGARFEIEEVWYCVEKTTRIGLKFGFTPEGWGF